MKEHFTTHEVAKILDLPESRIRSCLRAGLLSPAHGPDGRRRFTFQDLLLLKTTKGLLESRVPLNRIRQIVQSLRRQLPGHQRLSSVKIYADGRRVVVWDGSARWQPDSGQFLLNFEAGRVADQRHVAEPPTGPSGLSAEQWFDLAYELEKTSPVEAREAYRQALSLDPALVAAHVNLGRILHQSGERESAETHYRAAIRHGPGDPLAYFNLAVLLDEMERVDEAIDAYREALERDSGFADAHYNLALLYEATGRRSDAIHHFRAARRLYDRG